MSVLRFCRDAWSWGAGRAGWLMLLGVVVTGTEATGNLAWIWANPMPHGNNLLDMAYTNGFSVQVSEKGQIHTSLGLDFWSTPVSGTTNALRAMTFFGPRIIITGENGTVVYAENSTSQFRWIDLQTADWLEGVAASSNLVVAVGDNAAIYTSADGVAWLRQTPPFTDWLRSVTYGGGQFVAVGENGRIAASVDGVRWQPRSRVTTAALNKVAWITDRFWAVGESGVVLTSNDGAAWAPVIAGPTNDLFSVTGFNSTCLLIGDEELWRGERNVVPPNTFRWTNELDPAKPGAAPKWTYYSGFWDGGSFWIGGRTGFLVQGSLNLLTGAWQWASRSDSTRVFLWDVALASSLYVAVGEQAAVMTSPEGAVWTLESVPASVTNEVLFGLNGAETGFIAAGSHGTILYSPNLLVPGSVTNTTGAPVVTATNQGSVPGILWQVVEPRPTQSDLQGVAWFNDHWIVTGGSGTILSSPNGTNWVAENSPVTQFLSSVTVFPQGLAAVGDRGTVLTSTNGTHWAAQSSGTTNWLYRVRYLNGRLMAVGENGIIATSPDGRNWSPSISGTTDWLYDIGCLETTYYAVGSHGTVLASSDTVNWRPVGTVTGKSLFGIAADRHQLVIVGIEGVIFRAQHGTAQIRSYYRNQSTNTFLLSGVPGRLFTLDRSADLNTWTPGPNLQFLDQTGWLLYQDTNTAPQEFYRATPSP